MELGYLGWLWRRRSCLFAFKQLSTSCSLYHPNHPLKAKDPISLLFLFILEFASLLLCHYLKRLCCIGLLVVSTMATKIFKYISNIFVVKEREMEIGYPTDVKHVAHIGWDGPSADSAPSWMNEFKNKPDFSTASRVNHQRMDSSDPMAHSAWSSQDFQQSMAHQPPPDLFSDLPPTELPNVSKKPKRKKVKTPSSTARSSRPSKTSKAAYNQMEATQNLLI